MEMHSLSNYSVICFAFNMVQVFFLIISVFHFLVEFSAAHSVKGLTDEISNCGYTRAITFKGTSQRQVELERINFVQDFLYEGKGTDFSISSNLESRTSC